MKQTQITYAFAKQHAVTATKQLPAQQQTHTALQLTDIVQTTVQANVHYLRDGEVVVYKRTRSRVWQCKYKLFTGAWIRVSTRKTAFEYAARVATELYDESRYRERLGLAPVHKTFAQIARITVEDLRRDIDAGTGKKIYEDYCRAIDGYLIPFFGERYLQNIKHENIAEFERWRNAKMGKLPKSSTLMNFASAFNRVCATAIQRGWISDKVPLPKLSRKGEKGSVRPAFSADEVTTLRAFMPTWETKGSYDFDRLQRPLLCDYVEFLLLTGMRHGTEAMNVEWRHCEWYEYDAVRYLRVRVSGKTGERYLIAKHEAVAVLLRLHSRQQDVCEKPFDRVLGQVAKYVFRNALGMRPRTFNGMFEKLTRESGLMYNAADEKRTLYSLRHTYATQELLAGTDIHTLSKQMGNSAAMIEKHYSKLTATMAADKLA
jgi:integrase